jgi:hypothetical protein
MDTKLKKFIRLLFILSILTNLFLLAAYLILGAKMSHQYVYLAIHSFTFLIVPGILSVAFIVVYRVMLGETKGSWLYLKKELRLFLIAIIVLFAFFYYANCCIIW